MTRPSEDRTVYSFQPRIQPLVEETIAVMLTTLGTSFALDILESLRKGERPNLDVNPSNYDSAWAYLHDAQAAAIVKKNIHLDFQIDKRQAALDRFLESERNCKKYNTLLTDPSYLRDLSKNVTGVLHLARDYLRRLLGRIQPIKQFRLGPGASLHCRGKLGSIPNKLETDLGVYTHTHLAFARVLAKHNPLWLKSVTSDKGGESFECRFQYVDHNVFDTVPKDWKTDRGICIEAGLNMTLQLGVGDQIRKRLRRWNIDLNHLPDYHKELACRASLDGSLATIDLSAASDSISYELVKALMPDDWFCAMSNLRAKRTKLLDGTIVVNEKFSSMGNGFTFELETIIFMAIIWATAQVEGHDLNIMSVFGDDIIVDTEIAHQVITNLSLVGFETNKDKTFVDGPFRESCGGDFFNGQPVRPIYFKEFTDDLEGIYQLANRVRDVSNSIAFGVCCDDRFMDLWSAIVERVPFNVRFFGPKCCGDTVITTSKAEWIATAKWSNNQLRVNALRRVYRRKGRAYARKALGWLAFALYGLEDKRVYRTYDYRSYTLKQLVSSAIREYSNFTAPIKAVREGQVMRQTPYDLWKGRQSVVYTTADDGLTWN